MGTLMTPKSCREHRIHGHSGPVRRRAAVVNSELGGIATCWTQLQ